MRGWSGSAVIGLVAACGRLGFDPASNPDAGADGGPPTGAWGTPVVRTELRGGGSEEDPCMTADRLVIVWTSSRTGTTGSYDIWMGDRASPDQPFGNLRELTELNSVDYEGSPELSADGLTLYFSTDLPSSSDLYESTRPDRASPWGPPVRRADLSTDAGEFELGVAPDGLTTVINRDGEFVELSRAAVTAPFGGMVMHPELTISRDVASPSIDGGGRVVYFHAGDPRQLFLARRASAGQPFDAPVPVVELNTPDREADPFISGDERHLVYACGDDICEVSRE